jgi:transcriptional regulator with XRE-family HTH domain
MAEPAQRQRVAAELKQIREGLSVPGEEVAAALGWSQPKLSRIENARIAVSGRDLATLLQYYGVPEDVQAELLTINAAEDGSAGAWIVRAGGTPRRHSEVAAVETRVSAIRQYYPLMVPGQLQSWEYALANTRAGGWPDPESIVSRRMQRQKLLEDDDGPSYSAVLDARAFLAWPGSMDVMHSQLSHLRARCLLPKIEVRIIPLSAPRTALAMGPFTIYDFRTESTPRVAFIESQTADLYLSAAADVDTYVSIFDALANDALDASASVKHLAWLADYIDDLQRLSPSDGGTP